MTNQNLIAKTLVFNLFFLLIASCGPSSEELKIEHEKEKKALVDSMKSLYNQNEIDEKNETINTESETNSEIFNAYLVRLSEDYYGQQIEKEETSTDETFVLSNDTIKHSKNVGNAVLISRKYKIVSKETKSDGGKYFECTDSDGQKIALMILESKKCLVMKKGIEISSYLYH